MRPDAFVDRMLKLGSSGEAAGYAAARLDAAVRESARQLEHNKLLAGTLRQERERRKQVQARAVQLEAALRAARSELECHTRTAMGYPDTGALNAIDEIDAVLG